MDLGSMFCIRPSMVKKDKNDFTQHSQLHRNKITMLTTFNGHLFFLCIFDKVTWRLGGITFYLTTETRLNFQQPNFPGVYFNK